MALAIAMACPCASAADRPFWSPDSLFIQAGHADAASSVAVGVTWTSEWQRPFAGGMAGFYWEASLGRWLSKPDGYRASNAWVTQAGITPVLRWRPDSESGWFLEGGIGANVLAPIYQRQDKRFSTAFNFGDHLAVGYSFGETRQHELALRVQHFSNGGIKLPNPGENFWQLRYVYAF